MRLTIRLVVVVWVVLAIGSAQADVAVSGLFSDHMVLQRDIRLPVWGTASAGEQVAVTLGNRQASTVADAAGQWQVRLESLPAGGPLEMTIKGNNTLVIKDVLVGEVWVCSGQSNMAFTVSKADNGPQEVAKADQPRIRLLAVPRKPAEQVQTTIDAKWQVCSPETVGTFSAVGYFFGRELERKLNVPIGLIDSSWGGTPAEVWTPRSVLEVHPDLKSILVQSGQTTAVPGQARRAATTPSAVAPRQAGTGGARNAQAGRPATRPAGRTPANTSNRPRAPGVLYNGMIHPLMPYAIRGAIWYQGEANATRAYQYRKLLPTMIRSWREAWGQDEFPFLIVQLANYQARQKEPYISDWAELREAQLMTASLPKTGMAVTIDIGNPKDIHPTNKQEVGRRLSLAARAIAHGEKLAYSGPIYDSMKIEGDRIRLRFKHADGGLAARGGGELTGFAVAGEDRRFVEAKATVDGESVVVGSDQIGKPVAVRYAWADNPECNLVNGAGLPASPFRTDDWPGITAQEK